MPGVWRAAAYCSGAAVIFHSPRACAHVARSMDISAQYRALANGAAENLKSIPVVSSMLQSRQGQRFHGQRFSPQTPAAE